MVNKRRASDVFFFWPARSVRRPPSPPLCPPLGREAGAQNRPWMAQLGFSASPLRATPIPLHTGTQQALAAGDRRFVPFQGQYLDRYRWSATSNGNTAIPGKRSFALSYLARKTCPILTAFEGPPGSRSDTCHPGLGGYGHQPSPQAPQLRQQRALFVFSRALVSSPGRVHSAVFCESGQRRGTTSDTQSCPPPHFATHPRETQTFFNAAGEMEDLRAIRLITQEQQQARRCVSGFPACRLNLSTRNPEVMIEMPAPAPDLCSPPPLRRRLGVPLPPVAATTPCRILAHRRAQSRSSSHLCDSRTVSAHWCRKGTRVCRMACLAVSTSKHGLAPARTCCPSGSRRATRKRSHVAPVAAQQLLGKPRMRCAMDLPRARARGEGRRLDNPHAYCGPGAQATSGRRRIGLAASARTLQQVAMPALEG